MIAEELGKMRTFVQAAVAAVAVCAAVQTAAAKVLYDFETEAEQKAVAVVSGNAFSVCVTNAFATSGMHALGFACRPWKSGMPQWPSFTLKSPVKDWRDYDRLVVDVVSTGEVVGQAVPGEPGDPLSLFIAGPEGRIQNGLHATMRLPEKGYVQWIVPLKKWPKATSPDNIARIHFFTAEPKGFSVMLDRLTLLKKGETPPAPDGPLVGRDILPLVTDGFKVMEQRIYELDEWKAHALDYIRFFKACRADGIASRDMLLGVASSMEQVMPRGRFAAKPLTKDGLFVRLAGNEYESVQSLVASAGNDLSNVKVRVEGDLKGDGGVFSAANVECHVTGYVKTTRTPPYKVGRDQHKPVVGWWPNPILGFLDGIDIKGQDVQSFWIRVHCPAGQRAGVYRGTLLVSAKDAETVRVPLAVRVNGFPLGRTSALPLAVTFSPHASTQWEGEDGLAAAEARRKDPLSPINMWKKHRCEWVSFLADYLIPYDSLYHNSDTNRLDAIRQLKEEGRTGWFNLGYWSYPASTNAADMAKWREQTIPRLVRFYEGAKAIGVQDYAYVYGCDEVNKERFPAIRAAVHEIKNALPGVPVSTTAYDHEFGVNTPLDVMDWFTPLTPKFNVEKAVASRKAGHQVWWYICCSPKAPYANMFIECPAIEGRILMGAQSVRMRPDGFLYYQISIWNSERCITSGPFTDWAPRSWTTFHGDGAWTCVGPDGTPVPTIRLENFRDGLEDFAYAKLLEAKLAARTGGTRSVASATDDAWVRKARELLAVPHDVMDTMTKYTDNPDAIYRWRDAMADLIESSDRR